MDPAQWLPRVEAEVRRIGALQLDAARSLRPDQVQTKRNAANELSLVTPIDVESERQLHAFVRREFPDHSFLGEETGNELRDRDHYWIADPIDGTTNFVHGIPYWGPSLAYWQDGQPVLGLVFFPALDTLFTARRGGGAWQDGRRIHTRPVDEYSALTTVALHSRTHYTHHLHLPAKVRVLGSIIANMCFTASGTFAAAHGRGRLWDVAAGILVLEEAGAVVETAPDVRGIDPATYARDGGAGEVMTLLARADAGLPSLSRFLSPLPA
jgi:myo-inositol-1(or 4)-monophosphatase